MSAHDDVDAFVLSFDPIAASRAQPRDGPEDSKRQRRNRWAIEAQNELHAVPESSSAAASSSVVVVAPLAPPVAHAIVIVEQPVLRFPSLPHALHESLTKNLMVPFAAHPLHGTVVKAISYVSSTTPAPQHSFDKICDTFCYIDHASILSKTQLALSCGMSRKVFSKNGYSLADLIILTEHAGRRKLESLLRSSAQLVPLAYIDAARYDETGLDISIPDVVFF
jgi:hypothetical protein